jgi:outer membrane receptor for ferrienterochelin and colicins
MTKYIYSVFILLLPFFVCADNGDYEKIEGIVRMEGNQPAECVNVTLLNTRYGSITDAEGLFAFEAPAGKYTMVVSSLTTLRMEFQVDIKKGKVNEFPDITVQEGNLYLDEVVVTGTRTPRTLKNTPVLTKVISGAEIQASGAVTALEALENYLPGVMFTPNAMGDNINIAGLDNKYILVLVDGERMVNERTENVNFSRLNASDIKQIEVISGASSVLYGSNAIGSVINIITKDVDKPMLGNARIRYSKFKTYVGDTSLGFKTGNFSSKTTFSTKTTDGYDANRENVASDFSKNPSSDFSVGEVLKYTFGEKLDVELKGNYYRNETWFLHKYQTRIDDNYTFGGKLNYTFSQVNTLTFSSNTDIYRGHQVYKLVNDSTVYANGSGVSAFRLLDVWDMTERIQLVSGAELNLEDCYSENQFGDAGGERDAHNRNLFVQGEYKTDIGLEALVGARYTNHSQFGGHLSPTVSLMYKVRDFRFRANVSNGFKAPTIKELYMFYPHKIGDDVPFWIIGNPDLVPEKSWYKALSAEYAGDKVNFSVTVYDNVIQNKIVTQQRRDTIANRTEMKYENVEDAQIRGVDVSLQWSFLESFSLKAGYSLADAKDKTTNLRLVGFAKHNATCNLTFKRKHLPSLPKADCPFSLMLSGRFMSSRILSRETADGETESTGLGLKEEKSGNYYVTNFVYNQQFPVYKKVRGEFQFGIDNLLDYVNHDSASGNPGRVCFVSLGLNF